MPFLISFLLLLVSYGSIGADFPRLSGDQTPSCRQMLKIAQDAFHSNQVDLRVVRPLPEGMPIHLVLSLDENSEYLDRTQFELIENHEDIEEDNLTQSELGTSYEKVYLQNTKGSLVKLALVRTWLWSSALFEMRLLPSGLKAERVAQWRQEDALASMSSYFPPRVYTSADYHDWWLVSGQGFGPFSAWTIYVLRDKSFLKSCEIQFLPPQFNLMHYMPVEARKLAKLLSQTLGSDKNEGSLHPTTRLQRNAEAAWMNLLLRPWADSANPYNTRKTVDRELAHWATLDPAFRRHHQLILRQLPKAERDIAAMYERSFRMPAIDARQRAAINMDWVYRSYYVFPEEQR